MAIYTAKQKRDKIYNGGKSVSIGFYSKQKVYESKTPVCANWTLRTAPLNNVSWYSVCYGEPNNVPLFVAVSSSNGIMTSTDGVNWTHISVGIGFIWFSVCYGNGLFVAIGDRVMTSPDGINWTIETPSFSGRCNSICYAPDKNMFVAINDASKPYSMTSPDGINWTSHATPETYYNLWSEICYGNGLFVVVGNDNSNGNRILTSPDGINWTIITKAYNSNIFTLNSICYAPDKNMFVAINSFGTYTYANVVYSYDGIIWNQSKALEFNFACRSICYGNGLFVAVGNYIYGGNPRIATSTDGINWTAPCAPPSDEMWYSICYGNGRFVSTAINNTENAIMTSP